MMGFGYGMMSGSGFVGMVIYAALVIVPFWRLLPRFGMPNWVAIFAVFPPVALILLWIMAFNNQIDSRGGLS